MKLFYHSSGGGVFSSARTTHTQKKFEFYVKFRQGYNKTFILVYYNYKCTLCKKINK